MTVAEAVQTRHEADLEHELGVARAHIASLAAELVEFRDPNAIDWHKVARDNATKTKRAIDSTAELRRRIQAALGEIERFDAFSEPGYVAVLLVDLKLALTSSRDQAPSDEDRLFAVEAYRAGHPEPASYPHQRGSDGMCVQCRRVWKCPDARAALDAPASTWAEVA